MNFYSKEKIVSIIGIILIVTFFIVCVCLLFKNPANTWAMNGALMIAFGFAGYLLRNN